MAPYAPKLEDEQNIVTTQMGLPEVPMLMESDSYVRAFSPEVPTKTYFQTWESQNLQSTPGLNARLEPIDKPASNISNAMKWASLLGLIFLAYKLFKRGK